MAGYSGTPLVQKLGLKPNARYRFVDAPAPFAKLLGPLPAGVDAVGPRATDVDFVIVFVTRLAELEARLLTLLPRLASAGMLWVAWPKKASKVPTDVTEDRIRALALAAGVVDVKVCAVDETWSGLKLVRRLADRA